MSDRPNWENELRGAVAQSEREIQRMVGYVNDQVVPVLRAGAQHAWRSLAGELRRLADRMEHRQ